jgi:hypothetical protein
MPVLYVILHIIHLLSFCKCNVNSYLVLGSLLVPLLGVVNSGWSNLFVGCVSFLFQSTDNFWLLSGPWLFWSWSGSIHVKSIGVPVDSIRVMVIRKKKCGIVAGS